MFKLEIRGTAQCEGARDLRVPSADRPETLPHDR